MICFKPVKNRGKVEFYTHVEATMPSHFVLRLKVIIFLDIMRTASFLDFLLPVAIVAITAAICYFGIIGILPMKGSYLVLVCLTSIYQPLWLFPGCFFFASLTCEPHKRCQEQYWCFLALTSLSIVAWCTGCWITGPLFIVFTLLQRHKLDSIV